MVTVARLVSHVQRLFQTSHNVKLQVAAIFCISNLVWKEESGSSERQAKLKELGIVRLLQQLIVTTNTLLFDKYVIVMCTLDVKKYFLFTSSFYFQG